MNTFISLDDTNQNPIEVENRSFGETGDMFEQCIYCYALKLKPIAGMRYSPGECTWY